MPRRAPALHTNLRPTPRELRWFAHIDRHWPQSSEFLIELTKDTHRCKDTALRRLQALREAGYLFLPLQQRHIAKADFHPYVYDLTPAGCECLSYEQELERHARPTGHWWHGFWVSSVTSTIEITATRHALEYIPAARILAIKGVCMEIPLRHSSVIPDQLFAIKYADGYRAYALEVDRGTEPLRSRAARKSLQRSVQQYRDVLDQKLHRQQFGLKSNLWVLWTFASIARERQWHELLQSHCAQHKSGVVSQHFPAFTDVAGLASDQLDIRP